MSDERDMRAETDEDEPEVEAHQRANENVRLANDEDGDEPDVEAHQKANPQHNVP